MLKFCRPAGQAFSLPVVLTFCFALGTVFIAGAQSSNNILGLPAVPQQPQGTGSVAVGSRTANTPVSPTEAEIKSAISGNIKLASFYQDGLVTVRVVTDKTYIGDEPRAHALKAARLVQQGVRLSCGKLCKPASMPAPMLLANNTLSFDLILSSYAGILSTADMVNLVSAKSISLGTRPVIAPVGSAAPAAPAAPGIPAAPTSATSATSAASLDSPAGSARMPGLDLPDSRLPASAPGLAR